MEIAEIIEQFELYTGLFPRAAVEAAIAAEGAQREELTLELLRILSKTIDEAEDVAHNSDYRAHFYAMYLLAQFRETRAYPLAVRLALLPGELLEDLCGDFVTETLGRVLASVCGGQLAGIKSLIENAEAGEWSRIAGMVSLVTLVVEGETSREEIVGYIGSLFRGNLERRPSLFWSELVASASDLGPQELMPEIEQAFEDGLIEEFTITMEDVRDDLARGPGGSLAFDPRSPHHRFILDTVKEFSCWACFQPKKAQQDRRTTTSRNPPAINVKGEPLALEPIWKAAMPASGKVGRNDPCSCGSGKKYKKCCFQ